MVMAAGSVMSEPSSGAIVRTLSHHAAGVPLPTFTAASARHCSAKRTTGRDALIVMMMTTKTGSVKLQSSPTKCSTFLHPWKYMAHKSSGTAHSANTTSTSPRKWSSFALKDTISVAPAYRLLSGVRPSAASFAWCLASTRCDQL